METDGKKYLTSVAGRVDVVVLAVHLLGGASRSVDTEDVAMMTRDLAPGMFAWRKFPDQVNLELVRVALSDAKKQKNGGLLSGAGREGWTLTHAGLNWVSERGKPLLDQGFVSDPARRSAGSVDVVRKDRQMQRLKSSDAWRKWLEGTSPSVADVRWVFRIDSLASPAQCQRQILRLSALFSDDREVSEFLDYARRLIEAGTGGSDD